MWGMGGIIFAINLCISIMKNKDIIPFFHSSYTDLKQLLNPYLNLVIKFAKHYKAIIKNKNIISDEYNI